MMSIWSAIIVPLFVSGSLVVIAGFPSSTVWSRAF
jgi:hypothetical protein